MFAKQSCEWYIVLGNRICRSSLPYAAAYIAIISRCKSGIAAVNQGLVAIVSRCKSRELPLPCKARPAGPI